MTAMEVPRNYGNEIDIDKMFVAGFLKLIGFKYISNMDKGKGKVDELVLKTIPSFN